ncbi:MAG TPA: nickel-responsive transcriptional regulator NikR [Polyangia bacterium]|jgi:CopG family nickel-responsive transcriptional regulator
MKADLVRFGVAIDGPLLREIDVLATERGCTRSELFRDLARAEIARAKVPRGVDSVAALTLVYDHHVRDLTDKLTELQHDLGDAVRAALHVHLSHDLCMEVVVIRGKSDRLKAMAGRMLGMRGVKHGGIELVADVFGREHLGGHVSEGGTAPASASARGPAGRRAAREKTGSSAPPARRPRRAHTHSGSRHEHD